MENQEVIINSLSPKQQLKRKNLVEAALKLFNDKGFHQTRIEDIISEAKVGKGTFYLYFKNKEELVSFILDDLIQEITGTLNWVHLNMESFNDLRKLFIEEAKKLTATFYDKRESARFLFKEGRSVSKEFENKINQYMNELITVPEETYTFAISLGIMKDVNPKVAAINVVGGVSQIYYQWLIGELEDDLDKIIQDTVDFYLRALNLNQ